MKQTISQIGILWLLLIVLAQPALAEGPQGVNNTLHNLSVTAPIDAAFGTSLYATNEDEVCVFCHTPHGGTLRGPLWNHTDPSSTFTHYNSATLSTYIKGLAANRAPSDETLLCLSCHDGSISVNSLHNMTNDVGQPITTATGDPGTIITYMFGVGGANIGEGTGNLSNDHPVSFSYDSTLASPEYLAGGAKQNALHDIGSATGNGIKFFGVTNRVECSSCHDPHVDYVNYPQYSPFLVMSNNGSGLCLACHNK